jgi:hypothetical protein
MNRSPGPRKTARLSNSVHHQLNMYALAATAAGVGVLALAQPAEARIVYTSANTRIPINAYAVRIDLNHDGVFDLLFYNVSRDGGSSKPPSGFHYGSLIVRAVQQSNRVWAVTTEDFPLPCAAALPKGVRVGPDAQFQAGPSSLPMDVFSGSTGGGWSACPWHGTHRAYLGLKFLIKGKTHFGWARLSVHGTISSERATLTGYAYETVPNKPIIAGQTKGRDAHASQAGTLGALARGTK